MEPVSIAAIGWGLTATGWFISPYIGRLLDRAYTHIKPGESREKIRSLVNETVPRLKLLLEAAEGSAHKHLFEGLLEDLRSAFYDTEDILNEVEYIRRFNSGKRKWSYWVPKIHVSKKNWVSKVVLGGKPRKDSTKGKLDSTIGEGSSNQAVGALSNFTIPGSLQSRLKDTLTNIEKLITSAHTTLDLLNLQSNTGSDKHVQNVPANNINKGITSDPTGKTIGRKDAIEEIRERLRRIENTERLSVIGIVGIPGSGKTTLAQCVCQSEKSDSYFDLVMWIYVSKVFDMDIIYGEMFEQAWEKFGGTQTCPKYNSLEVLKDELKKVLNGKVLLLILDDIWFGDEEDTASKKKLEEIFIPLVVGKPESKILVTSRHDSLLRLGPTVTSTAYPIPDMDDAVFLDLFMHYALDYNRVGAEIAVQLRRIGAEIAVKLKKSPLLARVVGSILFRKRKIEVLDWINVRDQNLLDKHMGGLWWSYQHLGEQARRCFAYCSIFPRRHPLRRDELVNLWVAEGFINSTDTGHEMEIVGRSYFEELLCSSFLLPRGQDYDGKEYFLIHDLLHDLAVKVAGADCFKIENIWPSEVPQNVRHLSIQSCTASMVTDHIVKLKKLRTLIIYKFDEDFFSKTDELHDKFEDGKGFDDMFRQLRELRVLIFGTDTYSHTLLHFSFPKSIGHLKYLRYLGISPRLGFHEVTLPDTIEKLYLLQVLDLGHALHAHFSFSEDLIKLSDLRHAYTEFGVCFANMGRLSSLQTMPGLDLANGAGHELYQLEHLNKLEGELVISGLECVESKEEAVKANLARKKLLTELVLSWLHVEKVTEYSRDLQADVLEALCPPESIMYLKIQGYDCSRYPTWMVGTKESTIRLSKLVLSSCPRPVCGPGLCFITVSSLELQGCDWDTLPDNMKDLTSLEISFCTSMPSSLENLTSLERLIMYGCRNFTVPILPKSLCYIKIKDCYGQESEDQIFEKVKHIPHVLLNGEEFKAPAANEATGSGGRAR